MVGLRHFLYACVASPASIYYRSNRTICFRQCGLQHHYTIDTLQRHAGLLFVFSQIQQPMLFLCIQICLKQVFM